MELSKKKSSGSRGSLRGAMPTKTTINLAACTEQELDLRKAVPAVLVIVIAAALFGKFAVADRLAALSEAQSEVTEVQRELDENYARIDDYGDLVDQYAHYTYSGMTSEELQRVSGTDAEALLAEYVLPELKIDSWELSDNVITMPVIGASLEQINSVVKKLQADDLVAYCTVDTAATGSISSVYTAGQDEITAQVSIYLNPGEGGAEY